MVYMDSCVHTNVYYVISMCLYVSIICTVFVLYTLFCSIFILFPCNTFNVICILLSVVLLCLRLCCY